MKLIYSILFSVLMATALRSQSLHTLNNNRTTSVPLETLAINPASATVCTGNNYSFKVLPTKTFWGSYDWRILPLPNRLMSGSETFTLYANELSAGIYTLQLNTTDRSHISTGWGITTFTVLPSPELTTVPASTTNCAGKTTTLTAAGASSYTWSSASGILGTGQVFTVSPPATSSYTVSGTAANGCTGSATASVMVPTVSVSIVPAISAICLGGSLTLTAKGATSYTWTSSVGDTISAASIVVSPTAHMSYTAIGNSCPGINTATAAITITPTPTISLVASQTSICRGNSITIQAVGGNISTTYTWSGWNSVLGSRFTSVTSSVQRTVTPVHSGTHIFAVQATSPGCPLAVKTLNFYVEDGPAITVAPKDTTICSGASLTFTATGASSYSWAVPGQTIPATGSLFSTTPAASGIYTLTGAGVTCTNPAKRYVNVTVNSNASVSIWPSTSTISAGNSMVLWAGGFNSYTWAPAPEQVSVNGASVVAGPDTTTVYTVTGTSSGCGLATGTATVVVTGSATPAAWLLGAGNPALTPATSSAFYFNTSTSTVWQYSNGSWSNASDNVLQSYGLPSGGGSPGGENGPCQLQKGSCVTDAIKNNIDEQADETLEKYWILDRYAFPAGMLVYTPKNVFIGGSPTNYDRSNMAAYKLAVNGGIRARNVVLENDNWPDYVFAPEYRLMPLSEVAAFIRQNRRLPGIPSEQTIKQEGQNLGYMQSQMMQKIEELTLYMIQLDKENMELSKRLQKLKSHEN